MYSFHTLVLKKRLTLLLALNIVPIILCQPCPTLRDAAKYSFNVGILSPGGKNPLQRYVENELRSSIKASDIVDRCFVTTTVNFNVQEDFNINRLGWTRINNSITDEVHKQAGVNFGRGLSVVIGPFYANLAMILEMNSIPYIVTDNKGFDWIDSTLVNDDVHWSTLVEIKLPAEEINLAVVDLFKANNWTSAVVILPDDSKQNRECKDLVTRMINHQISAIPYSLSLNNIKRTKTQVTNVLRNSQMLEQRIIITCSPRDEETNLTATVLSEAQAFNLLDDKENVFFILDTSMYLKPLEEMYMYRQRLYAANCQLLSYRYTYIEVTSENRYQATAADAAKMVVKAREKYLNMVESRSENFLSKPVFLKALRSLSMAGGMSGDVSFNETNGKRINYTLQLYKYGGMNLYQRIGTWNPEGSSSSDRLKLMKSGQDDNENDLKGIFEKKIDVVVVVEEPFVMKRSGGRYTGNDRYEGFTIDVMEELARILKMEYTIVESPGNLYGVEVEPGVWDGMIGEVLSENATLGIGAISITSAREKVVDFSLGIISTGVNMLIHKPQEAVTIFQFMEPFSLHLWLAIIGASFVVSVVYFILDYPNQDRQFTAKETLWFSIGTLLMRGTDFSPRPTSQRIVTAGFTFFVLITVSTYTANMAAFLTLTNLDQPVATLEDLGNRADIRCGTVRNSATMTFLRDSTNPTYRKIWEKISMDLSNNLVDNTTMGRKQSERGQYAFIFDYLINAYSETIYCKTKMVGIPVRLQEHGIVMPAGAAFKTRMNIALLEMKERNFIQNLKKKWWENKRRCNRLEGRSPTQVEFSIGHMAGVFVVGGLGMACSLAFFLFKKFYLLAGKDRKDACKRDGLIDSKESENSHLKSGI